MKVTNELQASIGDIKLKETGYFKYGIWKSVFCVNAVTKDLHNENDCSQTVSTVLKQRAILKKREYKFTFAINNDDYIAIHLNQPLTFMFSEHFLLHNQSCNISDPVGANDCFINFGTYANKTLFNHIRC